VLMLRGPQTPGELRQRVERMYSFADSGLEATLQPLIERGFVARHLRRPGQKEERYGHRLSEDLDEESAPVSTPGAPPTAAPPAPAPTPPPVAQDVDPERIDRIERELDDLRSQVAALRAELGMEA
jgi:uncharacterized protein